MVTGLHDSEIWGMTRLDGRALHVLYTCNGVDGAILMQKKLTLTIDAAVYDGLRHVIGPRKISHFIEDLVRPHVLGRDLQAAYRAMAADERRESEALEWAEGTAGDVSDETR